MRSFIRNADEVVLPTGYVCRNAELEIIALTPAISQLFGFDTGSIGAITVMPSFERSFGGKPLDELLRGVVVASILIPSGLTGIVAGNCSDMISRKWTISLGSAIFAIGSVVSAASDSHLGILIAGRCIAGAGEGLFLGCLGVYICEISPKHLRASMMMIQMLVNTGAVAVAFFFCYASVRIPGSLSWRAPFILQAVTATGVAILAPLQPYSPRYLLSKNRRAEAERVLDLLVGKEDTDERKELLMTGVAGRKMSQLEAMRDIWSKGVRGRTILGTALNVFQQLSGIDFVLFFAPLLFAQAGLDPTTSSFVASGVTGILLFVSIIASSFFINKVGRRTIWLIGGSATAFCHLVLGTLYATSAARTPVGKYVVLVFIELFAISFTCSWASVTKLYAAEIQPSRTRAAAASFGQAMNQLFNFGVAVSGPAFLASSSYGPYFAYGGFTLCGCAFGYFFMPEVMGKSLESIDTTFEGSPVVATWPKVFRSARLTEARQRRTSRSQSNVVPGETRAETIRALQQEGVEMSTIREEAVVDD
ncbi:hypothetical protein JCM10212_003842 [Sporobolomyces blumeae]